MRFAHKELRACLAVCFMICGISEGAKKYSHHSTFENHVRFGYDNNVFSDSEGKETSSAYISDHFTVASKHVFSSHADLLIYWQPEFRYRLDVDDSSIFYQDLFVQYINSLSPRVLLLVKDHFRSADREPITGDPEGQDIQYTDNDLSANVKYQVSDRDDLSLSTGYTLRRWSESAPNTSFIDYDAFTLGGLYSRSLSQGSSFAKAGMSYYTHEYDLGRGGLDSVTFYGGYDRIFNPLLVGSMQLGVTQAEVEDASHDETDSTSPHFEAGLDYTLSSRTRLNSSVSYSLQAARNSVSHNASKRWDAVVGFKHEITAKIDFASSFSYVRRNYEAEYSRSEAQSSREDSYYLLNLLATYQINRNHYVEMGVNNTLYDSTGRDYDRNRVFMGWKLKL